MRLTRWFGREANVGKAYILAVKTRLRTGPQGTKSPDILVAHCPTLVKCVETERDKFLFHPAHPHAQDDSTTGEGVERGDDFRGQQGITVRQDEHAGAESHPRGTRRQEGQGGQGFVVVLIRC